MNLMQLKVAGSDDASAIAALLLESFREYRTLYTEEGLAATTPTSLEVLERLKEGLVWVAVVVSDA
jgi:hypothetical protein